jgi:hypothetical protein
MKSIALVKSATASEPQENISDADILVMISMIDYLITEIGRIDPDSEQHLRAARGSLAESVAPVALPRAH